MDAIVTMMNGTETATGTGIGIENATETTTETENGTGMIDIETTDDETIDGGRARGLKSAGHLPHLDQHHPLKTKRLQHHLRMATK